MFKKTIFVLMLVVSLIATSGSASGKKDPKSPSWEKVFTPPTSELTVVWAVESFKNNVYAAVFNYPIGVQIYRSANGKDWTAVSEPGFGIDPNLYVSWDMAAFDGKLYVSVHDFDSYQTPGRIMRSSDGLKWETVFVADLPPTPDDGPEFMPAAFGTFNGMLYVASIAWDKDSPCQLWRSKSGNSGSWEKVLTVSHAGFGGPVTEFKGYAYLSGYINSVSGNPVLNVWRSPDGVNWEAVGAGVLDDPLNYRDGSLQKFKDDLYLSTQSEDGGRVYRTRDGLNWSEVVSGGVGDPSFREINSLTVYEGDIYAFGTAYGEGEITYVRVYRSHTGNMNDWEQIPTDSWGDHSGTERMQQAVFKGNLYLSDFNFNNTSGVYKMLKK